jgi:hypothetical protein
MALVASSGVFRIQTGMNISSSHDIEIKEPNWALLEQHLGNRCAEFMWMYARDGVEFYKHIHWHTAVSLLEFARWCFSLHSGRAAAH